MISKVSKKLRRKVRALFISDVHLGCRHAKTVELLALLKSVDFEYLYLVGDIFDGYAMRGKIYWDDAANYLLRHIIGRVKKGVKVVYIIGNHDDFLRHFDISSLGHISVTSEAEYDSLSHGRVLVIHGDQFDVMIRGQKWLYWIGSAGYTFLLHANAWLARLLRAMGRTPWSLSRAVKFGVKKALMYLQSYEKAVTRFAHSRGVRAVVTGHIHTPSIKQFDNGVHYFNCGDWVESCSALAELHTGEFVLLHYPEDCLMSEYDLGAEYDELQCSEELVLV